MYKSLHLVPFHVKIRMYENGPTFLFLSLFFIRTLQEDPDSPDPPDAVLGLCPASGLNRRIRTLCRGCVQPRDSTGGSGQSGSSGLCVGAVSSLGTQQEDPDSPDPPDSV